MNMSRQIIDLRRDPDQRSLVNELSAVLFISRLWSHGDLCPTPSTPLLFGLLCFLTTHTVMKQNRANLWLKMQLGIMKTSPARRH